MTSSGTVSPRRILATVLFTDVCGSTEIATQLGDRRWRTLLDRHDAVLQERIREFGGRHAASTGDGLVAYFSAPGSAADCALAASRDTAELGLQIRAGLHTGECEVRGTDVAGIAVHLASRVCDVAGRGEVLVSSTVRELLEGGEYSFTSRGEHELKGIPDARRLFAVSHLPPEDGAGGAASDSPDMITVALVDDHPLWRHAVKSVLERTGSISVVGQASDGDAALELTRTCTPDVVLMDMQMRGVDGIEATQRIADSGMSSKVLIVSSTEDPQTVLRAVRAGASGYLLKDADATELQDAVRRIAAGEVVFPAALAGIVLTSLRGETPLAAATPPPKEVAGLSAREREVLALMAEGLSNQALAARLFVTVKTVEAHVSSIFTKLGILPAGDVHRRVRAVVTYLTSG